MSTTGKDSSARGSKTSSSDPSGLKEKSTPDNAPGAVAFTTTTTEDEANDREMPKARIFNSKDFMNFLTTQVDIANLMVETKDGERFKASFPGSSVTNSGTISPKDGPPKSVFKSIEMLKEFGMVDGDTDIDPTVLKSTVSLELFPPNPTLMARSASGSAGKPLSADDFASRDWAAEYKNSHVDVSYSTCFGDTKNNGAQRQENGSHKNRAAPVGNGGGNGDEHWNAMFKNALAPLLDAASVAQRQPQGGPNSKGGVGQSGTAGEAKKNRRKSRKIIPEVKNFCEFNEKDVLFGRGGRSNHHPGNKVYRDIVTKHQSHYRGCDKNEKTKVAQGIVDHMMNEIGARFLELDKDTNRWYLVPNVVARRKVGQALRENNTEEARAAKRAKYQGRYSTAASKKAAEVNAAAAANLAARPGAALKKEQISTQV